MNRRGFFKALFVAPLVALAVKAGAKRRGCTPIGWGRNASASMKEWADGFDREHPEPPWAGRCAIGKGYFKLERDDNGKAHIAPCWPNGSGNRIIPPHRMDEFLSTCGVRQGPQIRS